MFIHWQYLQKHYTLSFWQYYVNKLVEWNKKKKKKKKKNKTKQIYIGD